MFTMPLAEMKLRTKELPSAYAASFGKVRNFDPSTKEYQKVHQGWDLEAPTGTPCFAIAPGVINQVGIHAQFGHYVVLQFSQSGLSDASPVDALWAFYAHLSTVFVIKNQIVTPGQKLALTGHSGNASASAPHLHFEIRDVPAASPGLGVHGRLDPATILGYSFLVCS